MENFGSMYKDDVYEFFMPVFTEEEIFDAYHVIYNSDPDSVAKISKQDLIERYSLVGGDARLFFAASLSNNKLREKIQININKFTDWNILQHPSEIKSDIQPKN